MKESKYSGYFVLSDKSDNRYPSFRPEMNADLFRKIVHLDSDVVPDTDFFSEAMWIVPGDEFKEGVTHVKAHSHEWGELITFYGLNYNNIHDLGAEIEFTIDGETHIITESFASFIPAGVEHGPLIIRNVKRPVIHFIAGHTTRYE